MRKTILVLAAVLAAIITVSGGLRLRHHVPRAPRANVSEFESDMTEGLVRCLLREYGVHNAPVCFLAFGEGMTPPSWSFLNRFSDCRRPAVRSLDSSVSPPIISRHFEVTNGRPGLIIQIVKFKEYIPGTFDVDVAISNLPPGHDHVLYRISNSGGDWKIVSRQSS